MSEVKQSLQNRIDELREKAGMYTGGLAVFELASSHRMEVVGHAEASQNLVSKAEKAITSLQEIAELLDDPEQKEELMCDIEVLNRRLDKLRDGGIPLFPIPRTGQR